MGPATTRFRCLFWAAGSNLLVSDAGFDGLVLQVGLRGFSVIAESGQRIYRVTAGEDWDAFVERTVQDNCAGVECLAGIPGTVGGTPVQNVGAYGQEVASAIERVRAFDLQAHAFVEFTAAECGFCVSPQPIQLGGSRTLSCDACGLSAYSGRSANVTLCGFAASFSGRC